MKFIEVSEFGGPEVLTSLGGYFVISNLRAKVHQLLEARKTSGKIVLVP